MTSIGWWASMERVKWIGMTTGRQRVATRHFLLGGLWGESSWARLTSVMPDNTSTIDFTIGATVLIDDDDGQMDAALTAAIQRSREEADHQWNDHMARAAPRSVRNTCMSFSATARAL